MKRAITISFSKEVELALEEAAPEDGLAPQELIERAMVDHLSVRKFRLLRDRLMAGAEKSYTDQAVFDLVS